MIQSADVVIIGAGVVGTSIAYHLAQKGCRNVLVLERNTIASGSTGLSVGGMRHQFSTEINIRLSQESIKFYEQFAEVMETPIDLRQYGYLFLASTGAELQKLKKNVHLQKQLGVEVDLLSPEAILALIPQLNVQDLQGGTFCGRDGFADPYSVAHGFAKQARRLGVTITEGAEVTGIKVEHGRVTGLVTNSGEIATAMVVNAAGPHAAVIGRMVGVDIPLKTYKRHVFVTAPFMMLADTVPLVVDMHGDWYFRKEMQGVLLGLGKQEVTDFNLQIDPTLQVQAVEKAIRRVPVLEEARIIRTWAGLRTLTPDEHAILGPVPGLEGFICAVGFSGHGFQHAPLTGKLVAELIVDGQASSLDISALDIRRFDAGKESNLP